MTSSLCIGVDFDNTLVCYDEAFATIAREGNFLPANSNFLSKLDVRSAVRSLPEGEYQWQRLQGLVYGRFIHRARLFTGVTDFFSRILQHPGMKIVIISHKTRLAHHDPMKTDLHSAAREFLKAHRLSAEIFFEPTREEKLARITEQRCDVFIDDLPEVLLDPSFPAGCKKILFSAHPENTLNNFPTWQAIHDHFFPPHS